MFGIEAEACGGTHLRNTSEAELIRIVSSTKLSDGIVRVNYVAGNAAKQLDETSNKIIMELAVYYNVARSTSQRTVKHCSCYGKKRGKLRRKG